MKVALVQCPLWSVTQPPPGLAYVAASLKEAGIKVEVHDLEAELFNRVDARYRPHFAPDAGFREIYDELGMEALLEEWADRVAGSGAGIVGLSIFYSTEDISLDFARRLKERDAGIAVVLGGPSCDRRVHGLRFIENPHVDAVVTGEGERTVVELVQSYDPQKGLFARTLGAVVRGGDGRVLDGEDRPAERDLDGIPFPDYSHFDLGSYARPGSLPLLTSRGCPNRCKFCSDRGFWRKYRTRSAGNVFAEIKRYHDEMGVRRFYWVDSLINGDMRKLESLLDLILDAGLSIRWYGFASIRKEMTAGMLAKMARAGCMLLQYGIESGSAKVRGDMGKSPDIGLVERVVRDTRRAGIRVQGLFIVGYPTETNRDFLETLRFIWRNRKHIDYLVRPTCPYVCLPNSILYEERDAWGILLEEDKYAEWTSRDGGNTYGKRKRRLALFRWFSRAVGIPPEIGPDVFSEIGRDASPPGSVDDVAVPEESRRARVLAIEGPSALARRSRGRYAVRIANAGGATFHERMRSGVNPVGLGYHWLDRTGTVRVFDDGGRAYLERALSPGQETTLEIEVKPPPVKGVYLLRFEVVQDGVAWFETEQSEGPGLEVRVS